MTSGSLPDAASSDPGIDGPGEGSAVNRRHAFSFPRPPRSIVAVVESLVIGAALPAVGFLINRTDPFFLGRPFSWIVLPPLLAGIRHGFAAGCASASVMAFALVLSVRYHVFGVDAFPGEALLGMVLVTMIVGHVSDVWHRDAERTRALLESAGRRANEFARAHFLLSLSHERLEEQNQGAANLRDALARIRQLRATTPGESWAVLAQPMMSILSRYAMLEAGSLVSLNDDGRPFQVLASIGRSLPVNPLDPVLRDAFRSRELFYVQGGVSSELLSPTQTPRLLAAVPMVDAGGKLHGMLCVQEMPFMAFHKKNLEALALLTGHFADVATGRGTRLGIRMASAWSTSTTIFGVLCTIAAYSTSHQSSRCWGSRTARPLRASPTFLWQERCVREIRCVAPAMIPMHPPYRCFFRWPTSWSDRRSTPGWNRSFNGRSVRDLPRAEESSRFA